MGSLKYAVFVSTFIVFSCESLLHYNIGRNGLKTFEFPNYIELIEIIGVVLIFSGINALLSKYLFNLKNEDDDENP